MGFMEQCIGAVFTVGILAVVVESTYEVYLEANPPTSVIALTIAFLFLAFKFAPISMLVGLAALALVLHSKARVFENAVLPPPCGSPTFPIGFLFVPQHLPFTAPDNPIFLRKMAALVYVHQCDGHSVPLAPSCNAHDQCYDRCDETQAACDAALRKSLLLACTSLEHVGRSCYETCQKQARVMSRLQALSSADAWKAARRKC